MFGYLPQVILIALIIYDLVVTYRERSRTKRVNVVNAAVGWITVLALLLVGGFFNNFIP